MPDPTTPAPNQAPEPTTPATSAPETRAPAPEPTAPEPTALSAPGRDAPADTASAPGGPELTIPPDTVAWIILKAREYDMKEPGTVESDDADGHNPLGVLEDRADDSTEAELQSWIADLNDTEQAELVALMWLGRGDDEPENFAPLVEQARASRTDARGRPRRTATYLLGTPRLGDYLEEGLERLGIATADLEGTLR